VLTRLKIYHHSVYYGSVFITSWIHPMRTLDSLQAHLNQVQGRRLSLREFKAFVESLPSVDMIEAEDLPPYQQER